MKKLKKVVQKLLHNLTETQNVKVWLLEHIFDLEVSISEHWFMGACLKDHGTHLHKIPLWNFL